MNTDQLFLIQIGITALFILALLRYFRPFLRKILVDLCGTDDRAQFWTTFTNILLFALPIISALGFAPKTGLANPALVIANQMRVNLLSFIFGLIVIGLIMMFFTVFTSIKTLTERK